MAKQCSTSTNQTNNPWAKWQDLLSDLTETCLLRSFLLLTGCAFLCFVASSFVLDFLYAYPMCEICLLQRFVMVMMAGLGLVGAALCRRFPRLGMGAFIAIGFFLGTGFGFAVSHVYMLNAASSGSAAHTCQIVSELTIIPDFWYDFFHSRYFFVPCNQVSSAFLGVGFPLWSLIIYVIYGLIYALVASVFLRYILPRFLLKMRRSSFYYWFQMLGSCALVLFFVLWMSASIYVVVMQRKIMYKPDHYGKVHHALMQSVDSIAYRTSMGRQWAYEYPRGALTRAHFDHERKSLWIVLSGRDVMALEGLAGDVGWSHLFDHFVPRASFLLVDYPGFGKNEGYPSEAYNRETVLKAYEAWRQRHGVAADEEINVFLLGHSMGTGVAVDVAKLLPEVKGVVLMSPFSSIFHMSKDFMGTWMAWTIHPFLIDRYPTEHRLRELHASNPQLPVAIIHGNADDVISVAHSQHMVHENSWIEYHECDGAGHSRMDLTDGYTVELMNKMMRLTLPERMSSKEGA